MKIVVLDGYCENPGDLSWAPLEQFGEVVVYDRTPDTKEAVVERLKDADILVGNKNNITAEIMDACPKLKYIAVQATGYNVIDVAAAKERGIPVSNVPTYGTMAVAQHTMALLLEITNLVGHHNDRVHAGRWAEGPDWCFWDTAAALMPPAANWSRGGTSMRW
jgi:glycerate dehydrogenase